MPAPIDLAALQLTTLAEQPQWLPVIASWQHRHWRRGTLAQCRHKLESHLQIGAFPVTLILLQSPQNADESQAVDVYLGSASLVHYRRLGGIAPSYWLANVFVCPEARCQGVGRTLIRLAETYARQRQITTLYLYATDRAGYYQSLGWQPLRQHTLGQQPATIMQRQLTGTASEPLNGSDPTSGH